MAQTRREVTQIELARLYRAEVFALPIFGMVRRSDSWDSQSSLSASALQETP
jgi:hypothetical protein